MGVIARLWVEVGADTKKFETGVKGVQDKLTKLQGGLNKFGNVMTMGVTLPILAMGKGMLDAAMDLEATEAKFNTVFAGMTDEASAFIKEFKKLTPLTTTQARGVASGIQDLLVPMGFLREDATALTGRFMPLIGALANFNNATHTAEEVAMALSSALVGEYEPMRRLGVVTSKSAIDQRVLAMGIAATKDEITDQMRVMALLEIITEGSADAISAYTEKNLDAKTKLGLLKVEFIDTAAQLGTSLLPMLERAVEYIGRLATWVGSLTVEQQESLLKWLAFAAVIGPASKVAAGVVGLTNMIIGLRTSMMVARAAALGLAGANTTLGASSAAATAGFAAWGIWAAAIVAAIGLVIYYVNNAVSAFNRLRAAQNATAGGKSSYTAAAPAASNLWKGFGNSGTGFTFKGMFASGGVVPGPIGQPGLAVVHGGETVLPTHQSSWNGGGGTGNTIRHEIDLINVPATVDGASLERTLVEMLNAPQVKRKIDRVNYENQIGAVRGLGA